MRELAVEEIVKIVIAVLIGTILIGVIAGDGVQTAIENGITTNINNAAGMGDGMPEPDYGSLSN